MSIVDNGVGVAAGELPTLFERYKQASEAKEGSGEVNAMHLAEQLRGIRKGAAK